MAKVITFVVATLFACVLCVCEGGELRYNFYKNSCPSAEDTVKKLVEKHIAQDQTLAASLLRMHFHDCFVRGCDGSVLINSTANNSAEKETNQNVFLRGFDVIDDIKAQIEKTCPGIVSCADILAIVARDAVVAANGPSWRVRTGRRDGAISRDSEAVANLPSPFSNFTTLKADFAAKGLSVKDLVVLSGGHTIGVSPCVAFSNRLFNFSGKGDMDPSLDATYAEQLKSKCISLANTTISVEMDPGSSLTFDTHYFAILKQNKGLFQSDAALLTHGNAAKIVNKQLKQSAFFENFKNSMQQMSEIQVLTGTAGEIRQHCALVN